MKNNRYFQKKFFLRKTVQIGRDCIDTVFLTAKWFNLKSKILEIFTVSLKKSFFLKTAVDSEGNRKQIEQNKNVISEEIRPQQLELFEEKLLAPESRSRHQLIGQIFDTYWLVQFEDKFFIIDQHAAHEKVYYERFVKRFREQTVESQYLSPPLIVSLNLQEEALLRLTVNISFPVLF